MQPTKVKIIAEVAQGYEGNFELAKLLAKAAIKGQADAVKFQMVFADELCVPQYPYYSFFSTLEMSFEKWQALTNQVREAGLEMYFDVYGLKSLEWAEKLGAKGVKISTTDFYNSTLIEQALEKFEHVLMSIGGVPADEFETVWTRLSTKKNKVTFLHGFQAEPTESKDNHLLRLKTLREKFSGISLGFMDHALGTSDSAFHLPILALGVGIEVLEKHISLDPTLEVEDYISALDPCRFKQFVSVFREMESALGSSSLELNAKEKEYKAKAGKVVVANLPLQKGATLEKKHLTLKRVSTQPDPQFIRQLDLLIGKTVNKNFSANDPILSGDYHG